MPVWEQSRAICNKGPCRGVLRPKDTKGVLFFLRSKAKRAGLEKRRVPILIEGRKQTNRKKKQKETQDSERQALFLFPVCLLASLN